MNSRATLLLRFDGPLQSWGYRSRFSHRDTGLEPTKSGVIGLLCCALGRDRSVPPNDLADLTMHVRVDCGGRLLTDFHTAGGGNFRGRNDYFAPTSSGNRGKNPVVTERQYLQDAHFTVAIEGDFQLILQLAEAVQDPVWPLNLGRKSCSPASPIFLAVTEEDAETALINAPSEIYPQDTRRRDSRPRFVWERPQPTVNTETRNDVPVSWPNRLERNYRVRFVEVTLGEWPE